MKPLMALCVSVAWLGIADAQGVPSSSTPTWPQVAEVIERLDASHSLLDVEQVLRANAGIVANAATDTLLGAILQNDQLTAEQRTLVSLAQETFRDARAGGIELAAETLGVRVTILELIAARTPPDVRAVLVKRRDVTSSPRLSEAFTRLVAQPGVNAVAMQEIATAFREANQSPDAAVARLLRLAGGTAPPPAGATAGAGTGSNASPLVGHWRCTTIVGSGDASLTTDHHMVLNGDGTFSSWQHSISSFSGRESSTTPETGRWSVRGTTLVFTGADGRPVDVAFQRSGETILLPNESSRRIWERVR